MELLFYIVVAITGVGAFCYAKKNAIEGDYSCIFFAIIASSLISVCVVAGLQVILKTIINIFYW